MFFYPMYTCTSIRALRFCFCFFFGWWYGPSVDNLKQSQLTLLYVYKLLSRYMSLVNNVIFPLKLFENKLRTCRFAIQFLSVLILLTTLWDSIKTIIAIYLIFLKCCRWRRHTSKFSLKIVTSLFFNENKEMQIAI
jgi:hypothetical protein